MKGFQYQAELIAPDEEERLLDEIGKLELKEAPYRQFTAKRRIAMFEPVPEFLVPLRDKVAAWAAIAPERIVHALVTEYRPGTQLGYAMRDEARWGWQHSIAPAPMLRYSVTFRTLRERMLHPGENGYYRQ